MYRILPLFALTFLTACSGDARLREAAARLAVEPEAIALAGAPAAIPGESNLLAGIATAPVAVVDDRWPLPAEVVEGGMRLTLEAADLLADPGTLFNPVEPRYRLALNIEGYDTPEGAVAPATLTAKYLLIGADGRLAWSETVRTTGEPTGGPEPARAAAEDAIRDSFRQMLTSLARRER